MKLTFKIIVLVVSIFAVLLLFLGKFFISDERDLLIKLQHKHGKAIVKSISTSIVDPVLMRDYPAIETVINNISDTYENVVGIKVYIDNKVVSKVIKPNSNYSKKLFTSNVQIEDDVIGFVEIFISNFESEKIINERIHSLVLISIMMSLLLILVLVFAIKKILIDKINYLSNETRKIRIHNLNNMIQMDTKDEFAQLSNNINEMTKELSHEIEQNRAKDILLTEQSRMAAIGDMLANIAHQWRQPLSAISSSASSVKLFAQIDNLSKEELIKSSDDIISKSQYLSETIEVFRNFLKSNSKEIKLVNIQEMMKTVMSIVGASLHNAYISVNENYPENSIEIEMVSGELEQAMINIINNAKDVLKEREIQKPKINIEIYEQNGLLSITIEDNAGGISEDVMPKIFIPYFTTKHESVGTGLGLHMSYRIINETYKGKLYVRNTDIGAKFFIEIPLDQK